MKRWGVIVLSIWLILTGLLPLLNLSFAESGTVLAVLAIATGILLILGERKTRFRGSLGNLLLSIWLIARGLFSLLSVNFTGRDSVMALLAIAAGILLLLSW